jgi:proline iminopeptidase
MREGAVNHRGRKIWYSVYGEQGSNIPLLVVHGGPGFLSMPQVVEDLAADRRVFFYDQLGCGRSDHAFDASSYTIEYYVEELDSVRRQLELDRVCLVGFSWGTALICSYLLEKRPGGVEGLILSGPLLSTKLWDADQRNNIAKMPAHTKNAIELGEQNADFGEAYQSAMMEYYRKHICRMDPWPDFLLDALGQLNLDVYNTMWGPSEFTITGTLKDLDLVSRLGEISIPTLLTCGDEDEAGVKTVKDFQASFAHAKMAVIPGTSHMHHIEEPEIYKTIVKRFLHDIEMGRQ